MEDLYIYRTIKDYYLLKSENIPQNTLSLLKNIESYLKDISDFLEELQLECSAARPTSITRQFEFERIINNYKATFELDCEEMTFYFSIKIKNNFRTVYHTDYWVELSNIKQEIENFKKWTEN